MFKNKKILILGCARSGLAAAKVLADKSDVYLTDIKELNENDKNLLDELGVKVLIGEDQSIFLDDSFDYVVKNPGILPSNSLVVKAKEKGIIVINEMEVAYNFLDKDVFIIGVTGSNGKTTTVTLIEKFLKAAGKDVVLGGNIGKPLCDLLPLIKKDTILLLEISDHQLMHLKYFKTNLSLLTNICPTHLDYHGTFENYKNTKKIIFRYHNNNDVAFINESNSDSLEITDDIHSKKIYYNNNLNYINNDGIFIDCNKVIDLSDIALIGNHNYENILASFMVINYLKIDFKYTFKVLKNFLGVEHRIEFVKNVDGVSYYNDSKATNPTSLITALNTFDKPIHLIMGGMDANQNFEILKDYMSNVKCIYAVGEVASRVIEFAYSCGIDFVSSITLETALFDIRKNSDPGEVALLSPASASFDQYVRFEDRGDEFKKVVNSFKKIDC